MACLAPGGERLLCVGESSSQVRAAYAGAWGEETWRHVVEVEVLDRKGVRHTRTPAEYEIGYRQVKGPDNEWFIGARLEFERKPGINTDAIKELLDKRRETQPIGEWSCGSVFINHGSARAADIEALILHVQKTVAARHGTLLHTEVRIVGESGVAGAPA